MIGSLRHFACWSLVLLLPLAGMAQQGPNGCASAGCVPCPWVPNDPLTWPAQIGYNAPAGTAYCYTGESRTILAGTGQPVRFVVRGGRQYTVSLCGSPVSRNTTMFITNLAGTALYTCDDDGCGAPGGLSTVTFVPSLTPTAYQTLFARVFMDGCNIPDVDIEVTVTCVDAATSNNNFCDAIALPVATECIFSTTGSTIGATGTNTSQVSPAIPAVPNADCASGQAQYAAATGDIWFSAVVPPSGNLGINTNEVGICAGSFALYRATAFNCPAASSLQYIGGSCSQVGFTGPTSDPASIFSGLTPGETVYIRYWERYGPQIENGTFQICAFDPEPPPNNTPCGAIALPTGVACTAQTFDNTYANSQTGGAVVGPPSCAASAVNDVWFTVTVTPQMVSDGLTVTTFAGTLDDLGMAWYRATGDPCAGGGLTEIATIAPGFACTNDFNPPSNLMPVLNSRAPDITPGLVLGETIYIRVWSENPYYGEFSICATENQVPDNDRPCGALPLDVNYGCLMVPTTIANATWTPENTYGTGSVPGVGSASCNPGVSSANPVPDVWYSFQVPNPLPANGVVHVDTDAGLFEDGGIALYRRVSGDCATNDLHLQLEHCEAAGSPYSPDMPSETLSVLGFTPGETVYVRVWRQSDPLGNFSICAWRSDEPTGDCVWQVNLNDAGNNGWQGSFVEVCNNGVCTTYTNLNGPQVSLSFGVAAGTPFSVTYFSNGAPQQGQNSVTVVQTDFVPASTIASSGNNPGNGWTFSTVAADCAPPPSPPTDCLGAIPLCGDGVYVPANNSGVSDLNGANRGCLDGENGGTWYSLNVAQDGVMAFTIDYAAWDIFLLFGIIPVPFPSTDYDFGLWGPYGPYDPVVEGAPETASLTPICPPATPPIRCNFSLLDQLLNTGETGLAYNTTLGTSAGQLGNPFVRHLNVQTGEVYLLYVTPAMGNNPYTISWNNLGPGGAPLGPPPPSPFTTDDDLLVCGPLPVDLLHFSAKAGSAHTDLDWATGSERGSAYFEVQRSADGLHFLPIGRVNAAGHSVQTTSYRFVDEAPLQGANHYRLRQVDEDGTPSFSHVEVVYFRSAKGTGIELYPNPATDAITVGYDLTDEGLVHWRVLDASGRLVWTGNTAGDRGRNRFDLTLHGMEPGSYLLDLRAADGTPLGMARFVKQ